MFMLPGVLLPLITLGVIFSSLVPGAPIDTCGNRPPRGCKMPLFLWCNCFTAAIKNGALPVRHGTIMGNQRRGMEVGGTMLHFTTFGSLREPEVSVSVRTCVRVPMCV